MSKEEWEKTENNKGLVLRPGHETQPKWIAKTGTRPKCSILGKPKNYTHKAIFYINEKCYDWIKGHEEKPDHEPDSYAIPASKLELFNKCVKLIKVIEKPRKR